MGALGHFGTGARGPLGGNVGPWGSGAVTSIPSTLQSKEMMKTPRAETFGHFTERDTTLFGHLTERGTTRYGHVYQNQAIPSTLQSKEMMKTPRAET